MSHVFGPVPSRRLGFSLGVDTIPFKTCTLDCIYCQLSKTTNKTVERKEYISADDILREIEKILVQEKNRKIDYITFSGSGEPTLNSRIGYMIERIKKISPIPVAILTNATLLYCPKLQEDLQHADLVIPSLDAPNEDIFGRINRPHTSLRLDRAVAGMAAFSQVFQGEVWLEIMIVKGVNDSLEHIGKMAQIIEDIKVDKIQLNTPVRPPAEDFAQPVSVSFLKKAQSILGEQCEIIPGFSSTQQKAYRKNVEDAILTMVKRRPLSLRDISHALGIHQNEAIKYLQTLKEKKLIDTKMHREKRYYYSKNPLLVKIKEYMKE